MRWFVEVSRVGDDTPAERYCLEAKAWQAALQEARKLRGDTGPLSKFSIELLDDGYRAVDPVQKIRYLVNQAPKDAALMATPPNGAPHPAAASLPMPSAAPAAVPSASPPPVAAPAVPAPQPQAAAFASVTPPSVQPSASHPSASPPSVAPRPSPPRPTASRAPAAPAALAIGAPATMSAGVTSAVAVSTETAPKLELASSSALTNGRAQESPKAAPVVAAAALPAEIIRSRTQEPTPEAPITYRETAFAVAPGASRQFVEAVLREGLLLAKQELSKSPPGQLVQLAVFDHVFTDKPQRPPLGTLAWKDWRGEPTLGFPAFGDPAAPTGSLRPPDAAPADATAAPEAAPPPATATGTATSADSQATAAAAAADPVPVGPPNAVEASAPSAASPPGPTHAKSDTTNGKSDADASSRRVSVVPHGPASPVPAARASRPRLVVARRRIGEDLISELFELMHDLHFARDIAQGADFVQGILGEVLPSDIALIQVFDINTRQFVVVRSRGPGAERALLHRTPDTDPLLGEIMRRERARAYAAGKDSRFKSGRWSHLTVPLTHALCGAVRQGGRYLGVIELANPLDGTPFHESEINAFDYICEQFADFVASRPVVLESDVILGR